MSRALEFLQAAQHGDGGWGYRPGGMSYVEPTAAVSLALLTDAQSNHLVHRAHAFLRASQHADGGWGIAALDDESGWMTAWAVWALAQSSDTANQNAARRGVTWLLKQAGLRATDPAQVAGVKKALRIDSTITGWAWQPGDAAWIFPTALTLLALHAMGEKNHPRIREGIAYLLDRAIPTGGWNIGNPFMVTDNLPPTVENTALALIALDALQVNAPTTRDAQTWITREGFTSTPFEWAWRGWYWTRARGMAQPEREALQKLQRADGSWDGNPFTTAIALLGGGER